MNFGGSWNNGGVDYFGDVASFRMWDVALSESTIADWMDKISLNGLESHPNADHLVGALNMEGENGQTTNQGALGVGCMAILGDTTSGAGGVSGPKSV